MPFANFVNGVMTGTNVITSTVSNIIHKDNVSVQLDWTGSPVGNFQIQVSNNYKPSLQQSEGYGAPNNGTWTPLYVSNDQTAAAAINIPTSAGNPITLNLTQLAWGWLQIVYTNTSGSGILTAITLAKAI
jgi:hypothetical protein